MGLGVSVSSLAEYLGGRFRRLVEAGRLVPSFMEQGEEAVRELGALGVCTIGGLDLLVPRDYEDWAMCAGADSFLGLVRNLLLIRDADAYFRVAWREEDWNTLERSHLRLIEHYNPGIGEVLRKHGIDVQETRII